MNRRLEKRLSEISEKNLIYILSFLVGILSGTAAFMLKNFIHYVSHFLTRHFKDSAESFYYLAYPMIGILISLLIVKYVIKDDVSHGISKILSAHLRSEAGSPFTSSPMTNTVFSNDFRDNRTE